MAEARELFLSFQNTIITFPKFFIFEKSLKMLTKEQVMQSLDSLPEKFSAEEVIDKIILLSKIEKAKQQYKEGRTLTTRQVKQRLKKWLK